MFKSNTSNPNDEMPHDIISSPILADISDDERNSDQKTRWTPRPEQISILESIFNSGTVNPSREEIRKIKIQLQAYSEVGDANIFYWFQNHKSRSRNKLRQLKYIRGKNLKPQQNSVSLPTAPTSSSSSFEKSSQEEVMIPSIPMEFSLNVNDWVPNSPIGSVNQTNFQTQIQTNFQLPIVAEPLFFPLHYNDQELVVANNDMTTCYNMFQPQPQQYFDYFNMFQPQPQQYFEYFNMFQPQPQQYFEPYTSPSLNDIMNYGTTLEEYQDLDKVMETMHQQSQLNFCPTPTSIPIVPPITDTEFTVPYYNNELQGIFEEAGGTEAKCTVFFNELAFEVAVGPFNVIEAFGIGAILMDSTGNFVPTDEFGYTFQSLQHGASYYLLWCM